MALHTLRPHSLRLLLLVLLHSRLLLPILMLIKLLLVVLLLLLLVLMLEKNLLAFLLLLHLRWFHRHTCFQLLTCVCNSLQRWRLLQRLLGGLLLQCYVCLWSVTRDLLLYLLCHLH